MRSVVVPFLVGAALVVVASCGSKDEPAKAEKPKEAVAEREIVKGRFANTVKVGENQWELVGDLTPPSPDAQDDGGSLSLDGDEETPIRGGGGAKQKRFGQSPLYVDGKPVAVVAYGELPAWLPTRPVKLGDGRPANRFRLAEYFEALGIPVSKIQQLHLYGGRGRVAIIPGDEIRRLKNDFLFSFTEGDSGKMRMHWDHKLQVSDTIDKVQAVAVYIEKKPPAWDRGKWGLVDEQGAKIEGFPYVERPLKGGVRFYLDGRIVHHLKRNQTFERKIEPDRLVDGTPYFRVFHYLEETGVETDAVVALELVDQNTIVRRIEGDELKAIRAGLEMSAPPASSGHVTFHLGPEGSRTTLKVTSIQLYTARRAAARHRR
jgi:hypothetical protein